MVPTQKEEDDRDNFSKIPKSNPKSLCRASSFWYKLYVDKKKQCIGNLAHRLDSWAFTLEVNHFFKEINLLINKVDMAFDRIRNDKHFPTFLETILTVGRGMNVGNKKSGGKRGFKLSTLPMIQSKMSVKKAYGGNYRLLMFVVDLVGENRLPFASASNKKGDLYKLLKKAVEITPTVILNMLSKPPEKGLDLTFTTGVNNLKNAIEEQTGWRNKHKCAKDKFLDEMSKYCNADGTGEAQTKLAELNQNYKNLETKMKEVLGYYGEDIKKLEKGKEWTAFFKIFLDFFGDDKLIPNALKQMKKRKQKIAEDKIEKARKARAKKAALEKQKTEAEAAVERKQRVEKQRTLTKSLLSDDFLQAIKDLTPTQEPKPETLSKPTNNEISPTLMKPAAADASTLKPTKKTAQDWLKHVNGVLKKRENGMKFSSNRKTQYFATARDLWKQKYGTSNPVTDLSSLEGEFVNKCFPSENTHTNTAVEVGSALTDPLGGATVKVTSRRRLAHSAQMDSTSSASGHRGDK